MVTDGTAEAQDQDVGPGSYRDVEAAPEAASADQSALSTRTIGLAEVVQPFLFHAAPAAAQTEVVTPGIGPVAQQKLPPGPANRLH